MADVRVRGAVSAKKSSKKGHKMVVTDDKVRVSGRSNRPDNADDADDANDDDFDDNDEVDGDFDGDGDGDGDGDAIEASGTSTEGSNAMEASGAEAPTSAPAEASTAASAVDAPNGDDNADDEPDEPAQEGAAPMTQESTPVAAAIVRPLHDRILVKRLDAEQKTPGGLFIPDNAKEKPVEGLVVAVGNGVLTKDGTRVPLDVKAGDRVLFSKYSGNEVKGVSIDGGEHLILREDDILAVLETAP